MQVNYMYAREMKKLVTKEVSGISYNRNYYTSTGSPVYTSTVYAEKYVPNAPVVRYNVHNMIHAIDTINDADMVQKNLPAIHHNVSELLALYGNTSLHHAYYLTQKIASVLVLRQYAIDDYNRAESEIINVNNVYNRLNFMQRFLYRTQQKNRLTVAQNEVMRTREIVRKHDADMLNTLNTIAYNLRLFVYTISA